MLTLQNVIIRSSGVVKLSISSQIFNATENIWILPNFILRRSGVVKNLFFEPDFQGGSKFLDLAKFHLSQVPRNQNFSRFCQISSFAGSEWSTLSFFSQIFSVTENF